MNAENIPSDKPGMNCTIGKRKITDKIARLENAGLENNGQEF